jgi:hypothetical protein
VKRRVGPARLDRDRAGGWRPRRGHVPEGFFDDRGANVRAAAPLPAQVTEFESATNAEREFCPFCCAARTSYRATSARVQAFR